MSSMPSLAIHVNTTVIGCFSAQCMHAKKIGTVRHSTIFLFDMQLEEDFVKSNPEWVTELEIMVSTKVKAEIQALSSFGFQYLSQHYLPLKLQEGDWI